MFGRTGLRTVAAVVLLVAGSRGAHAQQRIPLLVADAQSSEIEGPANGFRPNIKPSLQLEETSAAVTVDGILNDVEWDGAARASGFSEVQPDEGDEPPIGINVWMTFDAKALYLAFRIVDDPSSVRANLSGRDLIWDDDYVGIVLDTDGEGQSLNFIAANPYGIQGDTRISPGNEDMGFDLIYESAGRITESGYEVEMAIPFRSLRFPHVEEPVWRATFWITHPRDSRNQYSWAAINRDDSCWPCQFGYIRGLSGIRPGRNIEAVPTLVGSQSSTLEDGDGARAGLDHGRPRLEPSIDLKYGIRSDLTAELTLNPDFSQIESDAAQIDVNSTFALFYPERRPFFQEGGDLFESHLQTLYTRSINDPIVAGKLAGRIGRTSIAVLTARDQRTPLLVPLEERSELVEAGRSVSNVVRLKQAFPDNSYLGALLTDRRLDRGGSGSTVGLDGRLRIGKNYAFEGQFVASRSVEVDDASLSADFTEPTFDRGRFTTALDGERFSGHAVYGGLSRDARHWIFGANYRQLSPTFRADNGFITQNDMRQARLWQALNIYPRQIRFIDRIMPNVSVWRQWNFAGVRKEEGIRPEIMFQLKGQTHAFVEYARTAERFKGLDYTGLWTLASGAFSNFSKVLSLGSFVATGRDIVRNQDVPELGRSLRIHAEAGVRPTDRLVVAPGFTYAELKDLQDGSSYFSGFVARTRITYQFTRQLTFRTVVQYDDFDRRLEIDPLLTYRINPLTVFHLGSTHDLQTLDSGARSDPSDFREADRQIFFKFQYLVRR